mmetsp:Transcript_18261/g.28461  ORF Transcript_18261/g.28461 Transcript_18261/m.28461 type:complete len:120 (-) Transcript_18261:1197-1556(-)
MNAFTLRFIPTEATKEQLKYIRRELVKPYKMRPSAFANRFEDINLYVDFMPDNKNPRRSKLTEDEIKEVYIEAMPSFILQHCKATNFDLENKSIVELGVHFDYLAKISKQVTTQSFCIH